MAEQSGAVSGQVGVPELVVGEEVRTSEISDNFKSTKHEEKSKSECHSAMSSVHDVEKGESPG